MMPSLRVHHAIITLIQNYQLGCSARSSDDLAQKRFSKRMDPSQNFENKNFPRHKTALWGIPLGLLSFLFQLTISRPPQGMSKQEKSFTP